MSDILLTVKLPSDTSIGQGVIVQTRWGKVSVIKILSVYNSGASVQATIEGDFVAEPKTT